MSEQIQISEEGLREALREVVDPEIGMNIIELGLIRNMELSDEKVHITMIMTTPFCPYAPQLLEQTRSCWSRHAGPHKIMLADLPPSRWGWKCGTRA